jgi:two-component system, NtrC family, sensor histidine kinase HydH
MTEQAYAFLGLTALVAALIAVLVFAVLRFLAAARDTRRQGGQAGGDQALLAAALHDAVLKIKAQERAMTVRAEASEHLNTQIVASLTAGLLVVDDDGVIRILNPSARRLLGVAAIPEGLTYVDLLGSGSPLAAVIAECLATRQPIVRRALAIDDLDGSPLHLGVTVSPMRPAPDAAAGPDGAAGEAPPAGGAICLFTDIGPVLDLEEQVRLKDTLARLGELTAGLAHEFRNGLATIHGYARLLDPAQASERERPCIEGIRTETDALSRLVSNFLNFARPAQLIVVPVDLRDLVRQVAEELRDATVREGGHLDVSGDFPVLHGDDVLLRQAFSNLVRNAVEACREAGVPPRVAIAGRLDADGRAVRITISDNGPGIAPELRERIFRPFFTTRRTGTGLGLSLVQKIVVTHNGRVQARESRDGGACLEVTLPLPVGEPASV